MLYEMPRCLLAAEVLQIAGSSQGVEVLPVPKDQRQPVETANTHQVHPALCCRSTRGL